MALPKFPPVVVILFFLFCLGFVAWNHVPTVPTGHVAARLVIVESKPENCSFELHKGWNLVGLSCHPSNHSPGGLVQDSNGSIISIHRYNPSDEADPWKVYHPGLPSWVVLDLGSVDRYNGYWVNCRKNTTLHFNGSLRVPTDMILDKGWQLLGYPQLEPRNITEALATLAGKYSVVYSYNETDGVWRTYMPGVPWGPQGFRWMKAHEGFWINMTELGEWYID